MHVSVTEAITSPAHWLVVLVSVIVVAAAFAIHYFVLSWLNDRTSTMVHRRRRRVLFIVYVTLLAHIAEIWVFGIAYALMLRFPALGELAGLAEAGLLDSVYFSATVYSTLGFGDLTPRGAIAFLVGVESVAGFMLITWSASFTYLEMRRDWS